MPMKCDFLAVPVAVLEIIARKAGLHTQQSVSLAEQVHWDKPETCFKCCYFDVESSPRCMALINALESRPTISIGESKQREHEVFQKHASGAVLIGKGARLWHRHELAAKATTRKRGVQGPSLVNDVAASRRSSRRHAKGDPDVSDDEDDRLSFSQAPNKFHEQPVSSESICDLSIGIAEGSSTTGQQENANDGGAPQRRTEWRTKVKMHSTGSSESALSHQEEDKSMRCNDAPSSSVKLRGKGKGKIVDLSGEDQTYDNNDT
jgi:hypothetical protein